MHVWVLSLDSDDGHEILGVYTDEEQAKEAARQCCCEADGCNEEDIDSVFTTNYGIDSYTWSQDDWYLTLQRCQLITPTD